jgi:hypothetical protein
VRWEPASPLPQADVDTAQLWAESGCQALTHPDVAVPVRLVATVAAVVERLDAAGAAVGSRYGAAGLGALTERAASLMFPPAGRASCGGGSRLLPAADGWIAATLARPDDRRLLPAWLGIDPDAACVVTNADPWADVARRVADCPAETLVDTATALGLACARVGEIAASAPVLLNHAGDAPARPLTGLRVVNLASLWAGPLAADVLVRLGADVVCVESIGRPDGSRATRRWFDAMHVGQRSFAFDHRSASGVSQLADVLASADVVIEGSRPRALEQLGVSAESLVRSGPQVWLSITGYGREGANAMRIGLGDDSAAAGGLVGWLPDGPVFLADAIADPITGLVAASTICDLVTSGGRWLVDIALARVAAAIAPRPCDTHVARADKPVQLSPVSDGSEPFELGADTDSVLEEWLSRGCD